VPRRAPARPLEFPTFALRLVLIVTAGLAFLRQEAQGDTWWALRAGQDIWHDHTVSLVDRWSWTAAGDYWPDHEWLWQTIAYCLHSLGGMPLLAGVNGLLAIGAVALTLPRHRPRRLDVALLALAAPPLATLWALRPQVASMFLFALVLALIRSNRWWWIPSVMLIWANVHGDVVFGGLVLVAATTASVVVWLRERSPDATLRCRTAVAVTAISGLATLATPLGLRLWTYVLTAHDRYRQGDIQEWRPATDLTPVSLAFWIWVAIVLASLYTARRRLLEWPILAELAVVIVITPLAVSQIRNIAFFVLAAVPLVAQLARRPDVPVTDSTDLVPHGRGALAAAGAVAALAVVATYWTQPATLQWTPVPDSALRAVESCPKPIYNTYGSGAYLIWFAPDVKVFVDNRQDPFSHDVMYLSTLPSPVDHRAAFDRWGIRCAFVESESSTAGVLRGEGWHAAYDDGTWAILRR